MLSTSYFLILSLELLLYLLCPSFCELSETFDDLAERVDLSGCFYFEVLALVTLWFDLLSEIEASLSYFDITDLFI